MITKKQILDVMLEHMSSAYDNGNINDGGIHGGEEASEAILNLLQPDVSSLLKAEREATKEEIREWLIGEDFEGLAERL